MADKILPCPWFDGDAEAATAFYVSPMPDSHRGAGPRRHRPLNPNQGDDR